MKNHFVLLTAACLAGIVLLFPPDAGAASDQARVTRLVHEVNLLPSKAKPRPAALDDKVSDGTGVRTGTASRSELTFVDLTIERLGSNTVFSFNRGGRSVRLDSGSMLLRVPKDSGGANMSTSAVTVGITGTTVILEKTNAGRNKLTVLEGSARVSLNRNRNESVNVHGGQMEDVPAGATKLPPPVDINLSDLMKKHPLITDFAPLPSRDLIMQTASNPPVYQGQPANNGPPPSGPGLPGLLPSILPIVGVGIGPIGVGHGGSHTDTHTSRHTDTHTNTKYPTTGTTTGRTGKPTTSGNTTVGSSRTPTNSAGGTSGKSKNYKRGSATPSPTPRGN